jgi:hypothetical protein
LTFLPGILDEVTIAGEADGHETGVVFVVEALQGAGDSVSLVDGLLTVLTDGAGSLAGL